MSSITLHPKYGVNPTMGQCIICHEDTGDIALLGNAYKGEAPMHMVVSIEPCAKCREKYLSEGTLLVEASENWDRVRKGVPEKVPTGNIVVLKDSAFKKIFNVPIPEKKICMVEVGVLERIQPKKKSNDS